MTTREELKNYLFDVYHGLYRNGASYDDAMPIVALLTMDIYTEAKDFLDKLEGRKLSLNTSSKEFLKAIYQEAPNKEGLNEENFTFALKEVISQWEEQARPDKRRTKPDVAKVIQSLAKQLMPTGPFIDLAVGCGTLLEGMPGIAKGNDIDPRMFWIANSILRITNFKDLPKIAHTTKVSLDETDSIRAFNFRDQAVYMFDPPLGDKWLIPTSLKKHYEQILGSENYEKINSEIIFLTNFLVKAPEKSYFIGLFPSTFLTTNSKIHYNVRRYLIEKTLIATIKPYSGHVLLVGQKNLDTDIFKSFSAITIDKPLKDEQVDLITKELIKSSDINFEQIPGYDKEFNTLTYNRESEKEYADVKGYSIFLPSIKQQKEEESKTPSELIDKIDRIEESIKSKYDGLKNKLESLEYKEAEEKEELIWFLDDKKVDELDESIKALRYLYSLEPRDKPVEELDKWQFLELATRPGSPEIFNFLKRLYKDGRIRINGNKAEILFKQEVEPNKTPDWNKFSEHFKPENYDDNIKTALSYLDKTTKKIYKDFCDYSLLNGGKKPEDTLLMDKSIRKKDIILAFSALKELGLIYENDVPESEVPDREVMLYHEYMPYHPLRHGRYY